MLPVRAVLKRRWRAATLREPALLAQLVEHLHGKEGVDGSSPSEGFDRRASINGFQPYVSAALLTVSCGRKVAEAPLTCRRAILIHGFEYGGRELKPAIAAFETLGAAASTQFGY